MKAPSFIDTLLFAIVLSLVLPPVFSSPPAPALLHPAEVHILLCFVAVLLLFKYGKTLLPCRKKNAASRAVAIGAALVSFGVLCLSQAVISIIFKESNFISAKWSDLFLCLTAFLLQAFYEESVYRFYLPFALYKCFIRFKILNIKIKGIPLSRLIAETVPFFLFAFAHKYSGAPSILNALIAAFSLRLCLLHGKSLLSCIGVHTAYNLLQLLFIIFSCTRR